jgi:uncharacterized membrane protein YeaQ/YmgE (transglycosylase-associated protein family)
MRAPHRPLLPLIEQATAFGNTPKLEHFMSHVTYPWGEEKMPAWSLFVWLVIGGVAGLVARKFIGGTPPFGKVGDIILGIAGGVVGGYILALLGVAGTVGGLIGTCVTALVGALLLIWLSNFIKVKR